MRKTTLGLIAFMTFALCKPVMGVESTMEESKVPEMPGDKEGKETLENVLQYVIKENDALYGEKLQSRKALEFLKPEFNPQDTDSDSDSVSDSDVYTGAEGYEQRLFYKLCHIRPGVYLEACKNMESDKEIEEHRKSYDKQRHNIDPYWTKNEKIFTIISLYQKQFMIDVWMGGIAGRVLKNNYNTIWHDIHGHRKFKGFGSWKRILESLTMQDISKRLDASEGMDQPQDIGFYFNEIKKIVEYFEDNPHLSHQEKMSGLKKLEELKDKMHEIIIKRKNTIEDILKNLNKKIDHSEKSMSGKSMMEQLYNEVLHNHLDYTIMKYLQDKFQQLEKNRRYIPKEIDFVCTGGGYPKEIKITRGKPSGNMDPVHTIELNKMTPEYHYYSTLDDPIYENKRDGYVAYSSFNYIAGVPDKDSYGEFLDLGLKNDRNTMRRLYGIYVQACLQLPDWIDFSVQNIRSKDSNVPPSHLSEEEKVEWYIAKNRMVLETDENCRRTDRRTDGEHGKEDVEIWKKYSGDALNLNLIHLQSKLDHLKELYHAASKAMDAYSKKIYDFVDNKSPLVTQLKIELNRVSTRASGTFEKFDRLHNKLLGLQNFLKDKAEEKGLTDSVTVNLSMVSSAFEGNTRAKKDLDNRLDELKNISHSQKRQKTDDFRP
jgi:hypothetical protein